MLDVKKIRAISLDLDDTLWPIWPTIERAEKALHEWLLMHAPGAAALFAGASALHELREHVNLHLPHLRADLSAVRLEMIRLALVRAGETPSLAEAAFEVFFAQRQCVTLYDDALPALEFLSGRFPLVSLSNGNADVVRIGLGRHFRATVSAREFGVAKPDPRIFLAAAAAVDLPPEQLLHVGDDATLDGLGALNAGMQAAWLNRGDHPWPHEAQPHVTVATLTELCVLFE
jgi:FMN hydrolase / 5-amino-6-(5-phospho-D-ribitylamino)uracil phosphatase